MKQFVSRNSRIFPQNSILKSLLQEYKILQLNWISCDLYPKIIFSFRDNYIFTCNCSKCEEEKEDPDVSSEEEDCCDEVEEEEEDEDMWD